MVWVLDRRDGVKFRDMRNFWEKLPKPFFVLAPMEDVTDTVFRQMVVSYGRPDVFFTEFTNVDGICHFATLKEFDTKEFLHFGWDDRQIPVFQRLVFDPIEKPIVAQIWGREPEKFYRAAKIISRLKFDGVDINMACPAKPVLKIGCGGALIGQNSQVTEIVAAVKEGAGGLPISIKTRLGNKTIATEDWVGFLLTLNIQALTLHGRTVVQKSEVSANWVEIGKCVKLRDSGLSSPAQPCLTRRSREIQVEAKEEVTQGVSSTHSGELRRNGKRKTLIIGNGDIKNLKQAREMVDKYGVDGVMIGRGIFENPAVFDKSESELDRTGKLKALSEHIKLFRKTWGEGKDFNILKKFVKAYVNGFDGASEMRGKLMAAKTSGELLELAGEISSC